MTVAASTRLVLLSHGGVDVHSPDEDVRGRRVVDRSGQDVGDVADLVLDDDERKVRFLHVKSDAMLVPGATEFMMPVDAIVGITPEAVQISQSREDLAGAPRFEPDLDEHYWAGEIYDYWGYAPFWSGGYAYPRYPAYP